MVVPSELGLLAGTTRVASGQLRWWGPARPHPQGGISTERDHSSGRFGPAPLGSTVEGQAFGRREAADVVRPEHTAHLAPPVDGVGVSR